MENLGIKPKTADHDYHQRLISCSSRQGSWWTNIGMTPDFTTRIPAAPWRDWISLPASTASSSREPERRNGRSSCPWASDCPRWRWAGVRRILSADTILLDRIRQRRTAVFLALPDTEGTFSFLTAIFYQCLFEANVYQADHADSASAEQLPLHCFLDEFANVGRIPNFQRLIATIRSRGISCSVIIQNYAQGKAMYRDDWETIVGNCDSMLFLGGTETSTLEWVSKRLGFQTIDVMDDSESKGVNGSYTTSWRRTKRELMQPDELGLLPTDECIYIFRGVRPFRSRKIAA